MAVTSGSSIFDFWRTAPHTDFHSGGISWHSRQIGHCCPHIDTSTLSSGLVTIATLTKVKEVLRVWGYICDFLCIYCLGIQSSLNLWIDSFIKFRNPSPWISPYVKRYSAMPPLSLPPGIQWLTARYFSMSHVTSGLWPSGLLFLSLLLFQCHPLISHLGHKVST